MSSKLLPSLLLTNDEINKKKRGDQEETKNVKLFNFFSGNKLIGLCVWFFKAFYNLTNWKKIARLIETDII